MRKIINACIIGLKNAGEEFLNRSLWNRYFTFLLLVICRSHSETRLGLSWRMKIGVKWHYGKCSRSGLRKAMETLIIPGSVDPGIRVHKWIPLKSTTQLWLVSWVKRSSTIWEYCRRRPQQRAGDVLQVDLCRALFGVRKKRKGFRTVWAADLLIVEKNLEEDLPVQFRALQDNKQCQTHLMEGLVFQSLVVLILMTLLWPQHHSMFIWNE